ncbi:response regulator [Aquincola sp. S2]|uniref:histidine kinase n=1 Tax=Pseudaquabacterium terrae TaxID=2732868 RepID=A0ABX2EPT0_9BURK|nr:PAS domain-containing sensor histidine kinase [Aquabacterium terrae]NRF70623.1 response regulator [Aquabacterium terrae]
MAIWHKEVSAGIESVVDNAEIVALYRRWQSLHDRAGAMPAAAEFELAQLGPLADKMMLLRAEGADFRYLHYGIDIQRHAQFDMTGLLVSEFGGELGDFFLQRYREVMASHQPLYTVHFSDRAPSVFTWERLIMPLREATGEVILLTYNTPLESRQQMLEAVLNATSDGILALRAVRDDAHRLVDWLVVVVNRQFGELLEAAVDNPTGLPVGEAFPAWPQLALDERCRAAMSQSSGSSCEITLGSGGSRRDFLAQIGPLDDGCVLRLAGITERKQAEEHLREREQLLQQLFDNSLDGILYTAMRGRILDANPAACGMLGRSREALQRLGAIALIDPGDERGAAALEEVRRKGLFKGQLRLRRGDGRPFEAEIFCAVHVDAQGQLRNTINVRDISDRAAAEAARAQLEERLREAHKLEAVGTLARGIAHDFNNILGAMLSNVVLARQDVALDHPARLALDELLKSGMRAKDLVAQILTFSRQGPEPYVKLPLRSVVEEVGQTMRTLLPAGSAIVVRCSDAPCRVSANPTQLHQVLMNLCTNALHAVEGRAGRIELALDEVRLDAAAVHTLPGLLPGLHVRLVVRDNGVGMEAATRSRIFEPFYTTKPVGKGTGLGLSVVHGIVMAHGGAIAIDSTPGEGSCFTLHLPALEPDLHAAGNGAAAGHGERVLCVDDDPTMLLVLQRLLERGGYEVSAFGSGEQAIAAVREQPQGYDIVVTDYNMPVADGLRVATEIHQLRPGLPVVLYSGYISDELRIAARRAGVLRLVPKANSYDELPTVVRQLLAPLRG